MKNPYTLSPSDLEELDRLADAVIQEEASEEEVERYRELYNLFERHEICETYILAATLSNSKCKDVTRDLYREAAKRSGDPDVVSERAVTKIFGRFSGLKKVMMEAQGVIYSAPNISEVADLSGSGTQRYFVSGAVAGQSVNQEFMSAIQTYCKENNAKSVILQIRPPVEEDDYFDHEFLSQVDFFGHSFEFNSNLRAHDFKLHPQQINPLTGLGRFGQKAKSLIVAHTKMFMKVEPVANGKYPHILHSTGAVTRPNNYRSTRAGMLAEQDHRTGGLIVEVDGDTFHIRQALWNDAEGFFFDLDKRYHADKVTKNKIESFVMGDLHAGHHDPVVLNAWLEVINQVEAKHVFLHDALDGTSISHHAEGDFIQLCNHRPPYARTLETELNHFGDTLLDMVNKCNPKTKWVMVPSNHPEWLERYLRYGKYTRHNEHENHVLSLELAQAMIRDGRDPIEYYISKHFKQLNKNLVWLKRGDDWYIGNRQHAAHGDRTHSGLRGTFAGHEASYGSVIHGHTHSPFIIRDIVCVGTTTPLQVHYTEGQPTKWLNTSGIVDEYGNFQLITVIDGKWKI